MTWWGKGRHLQQTREGWVGSGGPNRMTVVATVEWKKRRWIRIRVSWGGGGVADVEVDGVEVDVGGTRRGRAGGL